MEIFADEASIEVYSGNGGKGAVSFRREKYIAKGGPDGGDGGKGGNLIFKVDKSVKTLAYLRQKKLFKAPNGQPGMGRRRHGLDGEDLIISVPPGTVIRDFETRQILKDLSIESEFVFLQGGKGGKGNYHFKSSVKQAPVYAQPGIPGQYAKIRVEINIIADVGFVGFPNAGKSSLLNNLTNANPEIASYPFTTKSPNLGVLKSSAGDIVLADIPGIMEGASHGTGLGIRFLKHISRTKVLAFLIDLSDENFLDSFKILMGELSEFSKELVDRPRVIIGSKIDCDDGVDKFEQLKAKLPSEQIFPLSNYTMEGLDDIILAFVKKVHE
ncbi:MAG: GTPase ObgE [Spirochaetales bacterium]|nr:GTPase ObgE [Spirochaetales bacterium]